MYVALQREPRQPMEPFRLQAVSAAIPLALLALTPAAHATVILAAESSSVYINTGSSSTTESTYAQLGGGTGTISLYPSVALEARINDHYTQNVITTLDYYFEVVGGALGANVPVLIATNLLSSGVYPQYGAASLGVFTGGNVVVAGTTVCTYADCALAQFNGILSLMAIAGSEYRIHMQAVAEGLDVSASADPAIFVDPSFADAANYQIVVSDGVANGPAAVPEPGTLALFGAALLCLAATRRRRIFVVARATSGEVSAECT